ncbi:MAG: hypothetical protein U5J78_04475 [Parasphingorhabdus sp.]|nr:hypothetical protein [Parasphingorhabdus sp.]
MTVVTPTRLEAACDALDRALDSDDFRSIMAASETMAELLADFAHDRKMEVDLDAQQHWQIIEMMLFKIRHKVKKLTDMTQLRAENLALAGTGQAKLAYQNPAPFGQ